MQEGCAITKAHIVMYFVCLSNCSWHLGSSIYIGRSNNANQGCLKYSVNIVEVIVDD